MKLYYDLDGNPIEVQEWMDLRESMAFNLRTHIGDLLVSTVYLGIDHGFFEGGPPMIFETMVFDEDRNEGFVNRYATVEDATKGHWRAVEYARDTHVLNLNVDDFWISASDNLGYE